MHHILVFGTGGVGSIYATILQRAGCSVTPVCRSNYSAVSRSGITLKSAKWGTTITHPPNVVSSLADAAIHGPFDFILVCSKAFPGLAALIEPVVSLSTHTAIVLAQNGIGIEDEYAKLYPHNPLISGVVWLPTTQYEPGIIIHAYPLERFEVGPFPAEAGGESTEKVNELVELFAKADATAISCEDVQRQRWAKIAVNASMNPICALSLCDDANLFRSSPLAMEMVNDVQREVGRVADKAGHAGLITEDGIKARMKMYEERADAGKEPSMLVDVRFNRPMEVEVILGNLVKIAEGLGVSTPLLRLLYVLAAGRNSAIVQDERWTPIQMGSQIE